MSEYDKYCREAAAALEAARFVSFLPDKQALIAEAQQWQQRAFLARSVCTVAAERSSHRPAILGPAL